MLQRTQIVDIQRIVDFSQKKWLTNKKKLSRQKQTTKQLGHKGKETVEIKEATSDLKLKNNLQIQMIKLINNLSCVPGCWTSKSSKQMEKVPCV